MKKYFYLLFLLFLFAPSVGFAQQTTDTNTIVYDQKFSDIQPNDVEVIYLYSKGIIVGNPDSTVKSNDPLNRAETMTLMARFFNLQPQYDSKCSFKDIAGNEWYAGYVSALCNKGLVHGYPDGTFQAGNQLNRAEALAILARGLNVASTTSTGGSLPSDVADNVWYASYAQYAKAHNLFDGSQTFFDATKPYTRADMFENLYRNLRLKELGKDFYDGSMDPTIVSNLANKNSNVTISVTQPDADYSSYFNALKTQPGSSIPQQIDTNAMSFSNETYKSAAYKIANYYLAYPLKLDMPFGFDDILSTVRRAKDLADSQVQTQVVNFYKTFGVTIRAINDPAPQSDINTVVQAIVAMENTYKNTVPNVAISLNTVSDKQVELSFNNYCNGTYYWFKGFDLNQLIPDAGDGIFDFQNVKITSSSGQQVPISNTVNTCEPIIRNVNGKQITDHVVGGYQINLQNPLVDGETYTLKVGPTLLQKRINTGAMGIFGQGVFDRNAVLPATTVTFQRNSAKEYVYNGYDTSTAGVAIIGDVLWSWPSGEIDAVPYDKNNYPKDFNAADIKWSVVSGNAKIAYDRALGSNQITFNAVGPVTIKVEYNGFSDERTIYYNAQKSI